MPSNGTYRNTRTSRISTRSRGLLRSRITRRLPPSVAMRNTRFTRRLSRVQPRTYTRRRWG